MQVLELLVTGAVQGVGFRPFVYRLAHELSVGGAVWNEPRGARIRAVAHERTLEVFCWRLRTDVPAPGRVESLSLLSAAEAGGPEVFRIVSSAAEGDPSATVMAHLAICPDCRRELLDPSDRRHRYPFLNCTRCGPRYSILLRLPYDRPTTTMAGFTLCDACRAEYDNPEDRRFHAQPIACPACGPRLEFLDRHGHRAAAGDDALRAAADDIRAGRIVAIKGLGGFHLCCDARNAAAVRALRERKRREEKPFAVMAPDLIATRALCEVSDLEADLLHSAAAPIVLLAAREPRGIADEVAPGNPFLGVMLPYTPLHVLLLGDLAFPIVATSGNRADEPICIDEGDALARLSGIADSFLIHNRPIARHVDDSIVRVIAGKPMLLRRARGYAPLPIPVAVTLPPVMAAGAHLKNTVALGADSRIVVSQHIGDLDTLEARAAHARVIDDLQSLYNRRPTLWAHDLHPDYASTREARARATEPLPVQHHHAHILAVIAEHGLSGPVLGVSWDGTGLGPDGTIWGGEFLRCDGAAFTRVAHLRSFPLPGGDAAAREPRRSALGLLIDWLGPDLAIQRLDQSGAAAAFASAERELLTQMIARGVNSIRTSSAGRLFDAVASLLGIRHVNAFEGQAAMELEWRASSAPPASADVPRLHLRDGQPAILDWAPLLSALLDAFARGGDPRALAADFHRALVEGIVSVARRENIPVVALGGGCFQNRLLLEAAIERLRAEGFSVHWPRSVPANDGGISLGQAFAAAYLPRQG